jgi:hypothetical protein
MQEKRKAMDEHMQTTEVQRSGHEDILAKKRWYQPPLVITFGAMTKLTRGSGGEYDDECTSGKQPGDEE